MPELTETRGGVAERSDHPIKLYNSKILADLSMKLLHLALKERKDLTAFIRDFRGLFPNVPNQTTNTYHDVEVENANPIKQYQY